MTFTLADGGIETALTDRLQQTLPEFAAYVLLRDEAGKDALRAYYEPFVCLARDRKTPLALDTPTWRANADWGAVLGDDSAMLVRVQHDSVALLRELVADHAVGIPVSVNGCVGPRYDDYVTEQRMSESAAEAYHEPQVRALAAAQVNRISAVTMIDVAEAIGVVCAARQNGVPVAVSFTVGADGLLPSGESLWQAIAMVDAATASYADGFFVNCTHPGELASAVDLAHEHATSEVFAASAARVMGVRLNAARHGEPGPGDPPEVFAAATAQLREVLPTLTTFGGCCGTDVPHIAALADALQAEVCCVV